MNDQARTRSILVIDDDWINRELMETVLKRAGYQVNSVSTGEKGIRAVEADTPTLVIVDLRLPDMYGIDVVKAIRALPLSRPLAVVVMSAMEAETASVEALNAGADMYISKVFKVPELLEKLKRVIPAD